MTPSDPNKIQARFIHYLTEIDETETNVVYLCTNPSVGIGWRLRRVRQVRMDGELVTDAEDHAISASRAHLILQRNLHAELLKQTQEVAEAKVDDHPDQVATLLEDLSEVASNRQDV